MKQTINKYQFRDAFKDAGRKDQFSYEALGALFDYLEELEDDIGEIELDPIALCCEYTEYENITEFNKDYDEDFTTLEQVMDETALIRLETGDGFIIQQY